VFAQARSQNPVAGRNADRLVCLDAHAGDFVTAAIVAALRSDNVALVRNVDQRDADRIMGEVAAAFALRTNLESQAAFAGILGHRKNVSQYYMTVNERIEFAIVLAHSEGSRSQNIQLASLYCHENTTDGGVSVLMNLDQSSPAWSSMKELVTRIDPTGRPLTAVERAIARAKFLAEEFPGPGDQVVAERPAEMEGVRLLWTLTPLRKSFSKVLQREVFTYWDSVSSTDRDAVNGIVDLMSRHGLLREPTDGPPIDHFDESFRRTLWSSGTTFDELFTSVIVHKLAPGEMIIQNNLTWTHAASNWTPGSGTRRVIAAFA
jgi:hypothetical protein